MSSAIKGIFIVGAKRTPFGTYGGKFVKTSISDLQAHAAKAALASANISPELIDTVNIGCVNTCSSPDGQLVARHAQLKTGIPQEKTALQINRLCGSGFQAMINGAQDILIGAAQISLTGGAENMSQYPFVVRNCRFGTEFGPLYEFEDFLWKGFTDSFCQLSMAQTAEKLGAQEKLTRKEVDQFSFNSQKRWKEAQEAGRFKEEIAPIQIKGRKGLETFEIDEHPRPKTTMEGLKQLPSLFKENGLVTAGSASGISDGAGAVIVSSEEAVKKHNLKPLARIVAYSTVGVDPTIMGIGPVYAIQNVLKIAGLKLNDIDLIEINEAFAAQALACAKLLKLDLEKLNIDGGAIALGHPLAASGARITGHLAYELRRRKARYAIGSACIGGGQGIAVLIEAV